MSIDVTVSGLDTEINVVPIDSASDIDPVTHVGLRGFTGLHVSTSEPTSEDGMDGDIWVIVSAEE